MYSLRNCFGTLSVVFITIQLQPLTGFPAAPESVTPSTPLLQVRANFPSSNDSEPSLRYLNNDGTSSVVKQLAIPTEPTKDAVALRSNFDTEKVATVFAEKPKEASASPLPSLTISDNPILRSGFAEINADTSKPETNISELTFRNGFSIPQSISGEQPLVAYSSPLEPTIATRMGDVSQTQLGMLPALPTMDKMNMGNPPVFLPTFLRNFELRTKRNSDSQDFLPAKEDEHESVALRRFDVGAEGISASSSGLKEKETEAAPAVRLLPEKSDAPVEISSRSGFSGNTNDSPFIAPEIKATPESGDLNERLALHSS